MAKELLLKVLVWQALKVSRACLSSICFSAGSKIERLEEYTELCRWSSSLRVSRF